MHEVIPDRGGGGWGWEGRDFAFGLLISGVLLGGVISDGGTDGYEIFIFRDGDGNGRVSMMDACPNCYIEGTSIGWVRKFKCKKRLSSSSPPHVRIPAGIIW